MNHDDPLTLENYFDIIAETMSSLGGARTPVARWITPTGTNSIPTCSGSNRNWASRQPSTDWRVSPNGDVGGQDVADALNYKPRIGWGLGRGGTRIRSVQISVPLYRRASQ
jgi:hypothetical protein